MTLHSNRKQEYLRLKDDLENAIQLWHSMCRHWSTFDVDVKQCALKTISLNAYKIKKFLDGKEAGNPYYCLSCAPKTINEAAYSIGICARCGDSGFVYRDTSI